MRLNNSNNNSRDEVNVNTRGMQFMNSDGFYPSTMLFGFWNEMISIKIHPALDKEHQTDSRKFNYEEVVSTAITLEKAALLADKIENELLPNFGTKSLFRGVPVGGDSLIGVGIRHEEGSPDIAYLAIFKALDEETKKPEVSIYYEFKTGMTINDYNPNTGEFTVEQNIPSELNVFLAGLRASVSALTHAEAHSSRAVDKWFRDRLMNNIQEIAQKLGVSTQGSWSGNKNYSNKSKDIFNNNSSNDSIPSDLDDEESSISKLSNIDDISQFMM